MRNREQDIIRDTVGKINCTYRRYYPNGPADGAADRSLRSPRATVRATTASWTCLPDELTSRRAARVHDRRRKECVEEDGVYKFYYVSLSLAINSSPPRIQLQENKCKMGQRG